MHKVDGVILGQISTLIRISQNASIKFRVSNASSLCCIQDRDVDHEFVFNEIVTKTHTNQTSTQMSNTDWSKTDWWNEQIVDCLPVIPISEDKQNSYQNRTEDKEIPIAYQTNTDFSF